MKWLLKILKNRTFILSVVIFILIVLLLVAGFRFGWSWERQILGFIIILFLAIIYLMYTRLQAAKSAAFLEESIKSQADKNILGTRPDKQGEIEQLKDQLTAAIEALKKSKLAKGVSGKSALYALPWYMFIGPPGSGKTTAIEHSGLEFPFGADRIRGVGGTRNCDWFFSNSAILLDTAGRYTTEEEDREEWFAFLDMLKKNRKKKPVNGVIIGVSIADLFNSSMDEVENHAKIIRSRIDELIQRLGVRFPVYLVFTKCDLIQGFVDFFGDFSRAEREQIWGSTFPTEMQNDPDPAGIFRKEFQKLYDSLMAARLFRLNSPLKREERRKVYTFPLEIKTGENQLVRFVEKLFQQNPYQENPRFRGFYFTSGTQEGVPIDRVIQEIAKQFNLPQETIDRFDPETETKSYFIREVFTDVIVPDQNLVEHTSRMATQRGLLKVGVFALSLILLIIAIIGMSSSYISFRNDTGEFRKILQKVEMIRWSNESFSDNFYLLEKYRQHLENFQDTPFMAGSIYRGPEIVQEGNVLYFQKLKPFISTYLYDDLLTRRLRDYLRNDPNIYRDQAYNYLRAYLLLGTNIEKLIGSKSENEFLKAEILALSDTLLEQRFNFAYQATRNENLRSLKTIITQQISYFIEILGSEKYHSEDMSSVVPFESDEYLVSQVRRKLGTPNIYDVYARIKREGSLKGQPFTIIQAVRNQNTEIFQSNFEIPSIFTREAYESYVKDEIRNAIKNPDQDDWVLGVQAGELPQEMRDEKVMEDQLWELYYQEYTKSWWNFLRNIYIRQFDSFSSTTNAMKILGDFAESPYRNLLETITEQTRFESAMDRKTRNLGEKLGMERSSHPVDREFQIIHQLSMDEGSNLSNILGQFEMINLLLESLEVEPESRTAEYAANVIERRSGELPDAMRMMRNSLRGLDPRIQQNLFNQPILNCWRIILQRTQIYLNQLWEREVYNVYRMTLADHYPINQNSITEIPVADLVRFLQGNDGVLWGFVKQDLSPFVKESSWSSKTWEGEGISLSNQARMALRKAEEITLGLGLKNESNLQIKFSLLPDLPVPAGIVEQVNLMIDGKGLEYRMGRPRWEEYLWPGYSGSPGARLEISTKQWGYPPLEFNSQWGWFRLLDKSQIQKVTATNFDIRWTFLTETAPEVSIRFKLRASSNYNPFGGRNFFNLSLPRQLN
ncbi:MAG: type VI secretion system membrane subunit TssM [Calditrichaeota bacterium]|nr:MAG: type VI secretion system membrane subunit TssM [Calditrichota bacterium]